MLHCQPTDGFNQNDTHKIKGQELENTGTSEKSATLRSALPENCNINIGEPQVTQCNPYRKREKDFFSIQEGIFWPG